MKTKWTQKKRQDFLSHLGMIGNVTVAAGLCGVSRSRAYRLRAEDEDFRAEWDSAIQEATDRLIEEARRRAFEGVEEPVFYQGGVCGYIKRYSDNLLMFLIKGQRPEYATERKRLRAPDDEAVVGDMIRMKMADAPPMPKTIAEWEAQVAESMKIREAERLAEKQAQ